MAMEPQLEPHCAGQAKTGKWAEEGLHGEVAVQLQRTESQSRAGTGTVALLAKVIFHDTTLAVIAQQCPRTVNDLQAISEGGE